MIATMIEENCAGKHARLAEEVKVCVLTFQCVSSGMSPLLVLIGRPQTNNESSNFGSDGM